MALLMLSLQAGTVLTPLAFCWIGFRISHLKQGGCMNSKEFKPVEGGNGCGAEPTEWMTILEKSYGSLDLRSFYWMRLSPFDDFAQTMQETEGEKQ